MNVECVEYVECVVLIDATRFFGIECGAVSKWDDKRDAGIVHGVHERHELQKSLKKFIRQFILCPKCKLPELQMKVQTKKSILMIRCGACGHKGRNNSTHKVRAYMINHPPTAKSKSGVSKQLSCYLIDLIDLLIY